MITICSIPKPFIDKHISLIQTNAIKSWEQLGHDVEIILCGNEKGVDEIAQTINAHHLSSVKTNALGTPLINDVFTQVQSMARFSTIAYLNADIILLSNFLSAIRRVSALPEYLMVGQRIDLDITEPIAFTDGYEQKILKQIAEYGTLHGYSGIDYIGFPKAMNLNMPDFAVGRPGWDNWLIYSMRKRGIPVIDATGVITALHQNHHYHHHSKGKQGIWTGEEAQQNFALAGGLSHMMSIQGASLLLTWQGFKKPSLRRKLYALGSAVYPIQILLGWKRALQHRLWIQKEKKH